ncbi:unnamed protein product, partial [Symbiodinium microadriaticum]
IWRQAQHVAVLKILELVALGVSGTWRRLGPLNVVVSRCDPEKNESVTRFWVLDSGWLERRLPFEGPGFHRSRVLMSAHHAASMAFCSRALSFLPRATVMQRDALRFIAGFSAGWSRDRAFVPLVGVVVFALLFGLSFAACLLKLLGVSFGSEQYARISVSSGSIETRNAVDPRPPKVLRLAKLLRDFNGFAAEHAKPRDGKPEIFPYFQAFTRLFADTETGEMTAHFAKPLLGDSQLQDMLAAGAGRIVHITRNPTQLVMSGYVYHRKAAEVWTTFRDPPDCLNCDHEAWSQIFRRCRFRCSYAELLQNLSVSEGEALGFRRAQKTSYTLLFMRKNPHCLKDP